jgi:AhpD family alkylhydroperoxidase
MLSLKDMKTAPIEKLPMPFRILGEVDRDLLNAWLDVVMACQRPIKLEAKTKILCSLSAAVASRCPDCIGGLVQQAREKGIPEEEIKEAASVALIVAGNPAIGEAAKAIYKKLHLTSK